MTDTTDGRRRRGFALALLVALTALFLAPAVMLAPAASASTTFPGMPAGSSVTLSTPAGYEFVAFEPFRMTGPGYTSFGYRSYCNGVSSVFPGYVGLSSSYPSVPTNGTIWPPDYPASQQFGGNDPCGNGTYTNGSDVIEMVDGAGTVIGRWERVAADTTAPTPPTVTIAADGANVAGTWTGATDNVAVTGYRFRWDDSATWSTWSILTPVTALDKAVPHTLQVQARDAAGNWSTSGIDTWGGCTVDSTDGCDGWGTGGEGDFGAGEQSGDCSVWGMPTAHCVDWDGPRPALADPAPNRWTFRIRDYGYSLADSVTYIVGWTCSGQSPVEGWASMRPRNTREFDVDCAEGESVGNFYVLGGGTLSEPDYADIVLWWGYYRPGAEVEGTWDGSTGSVGDCSGPDSCATYNYTQPAPASTPHPTYTAPAQAPVDGEDAPSAGCGFSFTDPSSWASAAGCEIVRIVRRLIDAVGSILSFLRSIPSWFVPRGAVLRTSFGGVSDAWDASPVGVVTGAVGDVTSPLTDLEDTSGGCAGPTINAPLPGSRTLMMQPFSACSSLAQLVLSYTMPLEKALVYLAGFFVALRILSRTVGLDGPDEAGRTA